MNLFDLSTLVFVTFIIIKIVIYHGMKNLQKKTWFMERVCVTGYYGPAPDPFECDAYYQCPEGLKLYCDPGRQFDPDAGECVPIEVGVDGCYENGRRRMLG